MARIESNDIHRKLETLMITMNESDDVAKEKFAKFLRNAPEL